MEKLLNILAELREKNIKLVLANGELDVVSYGGAIEAHLIEKIKENKQEFIDYLTLLESSGNLEEAIPVQPLRSQYPLSNAQRRLWLLCQHEEESRAYHMPSKVVLNGTYDLDNFKKAVLAVIERHEITRTVFLETEDAEVMQRIKSVEEFDFSIGYTDFRTASNPEEACQAFIENDNTISFDLFNGPLLRAHMLQVSDDGFVFYFNMHHIISDGWSMDVLSRDVMTYYEAYQRGIEAKLPELRIQYKDYAVWQLNEAKSVDYENHKSYWLDKLGGIIPVLDLPTQKQRPNLKTYRGEELQTYISAESTKEVRGWIQEQGGSLFTGLLAIWNVLIHKYTGEQDIVIGSPVSGRDHSDLANQIGFYVNTLALRNKINPEESFESFYKNFCSSTISSFEHQTYSFDQLIEDLSVKGDPSRNALFDVLFTLQNSNNDSDYVSEEKNNTNEIVNKGSKISKFDLQVIFKEEGDRLSLHLTYNQDVYEAEMVQQLMCHFKQLMTAVILEPNKKIGEIDYLSIDEKVEILEDFNNTRTEYPEDETIVKLFRNEANKTPNRVALVFRDTELTYAQLEDVSNQMAHFLLSNFEISKGDFIGIKMDRSEWSIISLLAVLKTGSVYVPIDINYPQERIDYMEADTDCELTITKSIINQFREDQHNYSTTTPEINLSNKELAYVIYTSGSTGNPKGVMVEQNSIIRLVKSANYFNFENNNVLLSTGSFSFDATTFEFFGTLLNGAKLVMTTTDTLLDAKLLANAMNDHLVDVMWFTSGRLNQLVDKDITIFKNLKTVLVGGDKLSPSHINKLKHTYPDLLIINGYGQTENTTFSLTYEIGEVTGDIPIGFPISNSRVYILDSYQQLVPKGVTGELYVAGDGLARGYLNRPDMTSEKFISNPFQAEKRLYRTGDLGRWNFDGSIDFKGRIDQQAKISGHRVELGEIEAMITTNSSISDAVVLAESTESEEKELAAYFVSNEAQTTKDLRDFLKERLPGYMIPKTFQELDELPLTTNGKVDKKALMAIDKTNQSAVIEYEAPKNALEEKLMEIWTSILPIKKMGVNEGFFELGGNSLNVYKVISQIRKEFKTKIDVKQFYEDPTIEGIARFIKYNMGSGIDEIQAIPVSDNGYEISNEGLRIWVASQTEEGSVAHHMVADYTAKGNFDVALFEKALEGVIERHEGLRTSFSFNENGEVVQFIENSIPLTSVLTFHSMEDGRTDSDIKQMVTSFKNEVFDLEKGPLFRILLIQKGEDEFLLSHVMHHIIGDFGSFEVLLAEIASLYNCHKKGISSNLTPLKVQNKEYVAWIKNKLTNKEFDRQRKFIGNELKYVTGKKNWFGSLASEDFSGGVYQHDFEENTVKQLKSYCEQTGRGLLSVMSTALAVLFHKITGQQDVLIGLPMSLRAYPELMDQVGLYLNMLPLRVPVNEAHRVENILTNISKKQIDLMDAIFYPFDMVMDDFEKAHNYKLTDRIDVYLNVIHHSTTGSTAAFDGVEFVSNPVKDRQSKFPIIFYVYESDTSISFSIEFQTELFNQKEIARIGKRFTKSVETILHEPSTLIDKINLVDTQSIPTFNF